MTYAFNISQALRIYFSLTHIEELANFGFVLAKESTLVTLGRLRRPVESDHNCYLGKEDEEAEEKFTAETTPNDNNTDFYILNQESRIKIRKANYDSESAYHSCKNDKVANQETPTCWSLISTRGNVLLTSRHRG